jgi:hypothetical protein
MASGRGDGFKGEAEPNTNVAGCSAECHTDAFWIGHVHSQAGVAYLALNRLISDLTGQTDP